VVWGVRRKLHNEEQLKRGKGNVKGLKVA
jgi:hypothetical protein